MKPKEEWREKSIGEEKTYANEENINIAFGNHLNGTCGKYSGKCDGE